MGEKSGRIFSCSQHTRLEKFYDLRLGNVAVRESVPLREGYYALIDCPSALVHEMFPLNFYCLEFDYRL